MFFTNSCRCSVALHWRTKGLLFVLTLLLLAMADARTESHGGTLAVTEGRVADVNLASGLISRWNVTAPSFEGSASLENGSSTDVPGADVAALLAIHREERSAHFLRDPAALVAHWDPQVISVSSGKIIRQTRDQMYERFTEVFRGREYSMWDDLDPPVVQVSPDHLMAWVIFRVEVKSVVTGSDGAKKPEHFICAWTVTYRNHDGKWWKTSTTSTFDPE